MKGTCSRTMIVVYIQIGFVPSLETKQEVTKDGLTSLDNGQLWGSDVEERDTYMTSMSGRVERSRKRMYRGTSGH